MECCKLCGKLLDQPDDPTSEDCGGDCRGCMDQIEADIRREPELPDVNEDFAVRVVAAIRKIRT